MRSAEGEGTAPVQSAGHASGSPLPNPLRAFFEPRFGRDFGAVRIHNDSEAATAAQRLNARAYTLGKDVVFGRGEYSPGTADGRRLLAHELTHVAQQRRSPSGAALFRQPGVAAPTKTPAELIEAHTTWGNLDEAALGEVLHQALLRGDHSYVTGVLDALGWSDRDDVALAVLDKAHDAGSLEAIAASPDGAAVLRRLVREVSAGWTAGPESRALERTMAVLTEEKRLARASGGKGRIKVEVITFETGGSDWLGSILGLGGHTAVSVGDNVYSFENEWKCGESRSEYEKNNMERHGWVQQLRLDDADALAILRTLNRLCETGTWLVSGDVCTDATAELFRKQIGTVKTWKPKELMLHLMTFPPGKVEPPQPFGKVRRTSGSLGVGP